MACILITPHFCYACRSRSHCDLIERGARYAGITRDASPGSPGGSGVEVARPDRHSGRVACHGYDIRRRMDDLRSSSSLIQKNATDYPVHSRTACDSDRSKFCPRNGSLGYDVTTDVVGVGRVLDDVSNADALRDSLRRNADVDL